MPTPYLTPATLVVARGEPVPTQAIDSAWSDYYNPTMSLGFRVPPGWSIVESEDLWGVALYPPDIHPDQPAILIGFYYVEVPYDGQRTLMPFNGTAVPIMVAGRAGHAYEDDAYAIPTQAYYIEVPYRQGILLITATKGPEYDLVPQLDELLKTVRFDP